LVGCKFHDGGCSWHKADIIDLLLECFASQLVSSLMMAGAVIKLIVLICCGILNLIVGKFSHDGCGWKAANDVDLLLAFLV
jgi:hypothetical protein